MTSLRTLSKRVVAAVTLMLALVYFVDCLSVRFRTIHPTPTDPFESITAPRILAIPEKNGKVAYETDVQHPQQTVTCVHSLFPHSGYSPCWYIKPKLGKPIPV